jgi:hypothetical protein
MNSVLLPTDMNGWIIDMSMDGCIPL